MVRPMTFPAEPDEGAIERWFQMVERSAPGAAAQQALRHLRQEMEKRRRVADHLRQREEDFEKLVEHADVIIARFDQQLRYAYANPAVASWTGLAPAQLINKTHRQAGLPAALCDLWDARLREAWDTNRQVTFEFRCCGPDGQEHWLQVRLIPEASATNQVASVLSVGRDLTEVKRAHQALEQVHQQFVATLDHSSEGFATFDRHWRFLYVNAAAAQLLGRGKDELLGHTPWEVLPQSGPSDYVREFQRAVEQNTPVQCEVFCRQFHAWHECRCYPSPCGAVVYFSDITRRKQAEQALRDSEERLRLLMEGVRDCALFLLDPQGRIIAWNTGAQRVKGYKAEDILGKDFSICYTPEDQQTGKPQRDLETASREGCHEWEGWVVRKDGARFWAEVVLQALKNDDGSVRAFAELARDITGRKRAEVQLVQAKEAAERATRSKDQFIAVLSHELRTPLTPVLTVVQMMERDTALSVDQRESLHMVARNVVLETRLIDDLLDATRISRGKLELHQGPVDMHSLLRHVLTLCESDLRFKQLQVTADFAAAHSNVHGDAARLQQVFWNLLKNAIKFTPQGGAITVRTRQPREDRLTVLLQDTGVGIDPELLARIFIPFEQGNQTVTRLFGGLGLGLSIAKSLVELHGGMLTAASAGKGQGATFTVDLPALLVVPPQPSRGTAWAGGTASLRGGRILLVEDSADTTLVMVKLLTSYGYQVHTADSVAAALRAAEAESFDLLLCDIGLPDGSGLDLMQQLSRQHPLKGIALSGYGMDEDIKRSQAAGFMAHLTKPVDLGTLEEALERVLPPVA